MKKPFIEIPAELYLQNPFSIEQPAGYETPTNPETSKPLPFCCHTHEVIFSRLNERFEGFPDCCETHKKLSSQKWFKKEIYRKVPSKVVTLLSYTEFVIVSSIDKTEWNAIMIGFIDWCRRSFGHPDIGASQYLTNLQVFLEGGDWDLNEEQRATLLAYINGLFHGAKGLENQTSFDTLWETYSKWLNLFPFEIEAFSGLKEMFSKNLPFLDGPFKFNPYDGTTSAKVVNQETLIIRLQERTKTLLRKSNYSGGLLNTEPTTFLGIQRQFSDAKLRTRVTSVLEDFTKGELAYVDALKEWLAAHVDFFNEIVDLHERGNKSSSTNSYEKQPNNWERLTEIGFHDHLKLYNYQIDKLRTYYLSKSLKELPHVAIALFHCTNFLKALSKNHPINREIHKLLGEILDCPPRKIRGNISRLTPNTNELSKEYRSDLYVPEIEKMLAGE